MRPVSAKIRNCTQLSTRRRERDNSGTREAILSKLLLSIAGCCRFLRYCEGAPLPRCNRSGPCQLLPIALPQSDGGRQSNALKQNIRVALSSRAKCWDFVPNFGISRQGRRFSKNGYPFWSRPPPLAHYCENARSAGARNEVWHRGETYPKNL
jgi:hypothetical protein